MLFRSSASSCDDSDPVSEEAQEHDSESHDLRDDSDSEQEIRGDDNERELEQEIGGDEQEMRGDENEMKDNEFKDVGVNHQIDSAVQDYSSTTNQMVDGMEMRLKRKSAM